MPQMMPVELSCHRNMMVRTFQLHFSYPHSETPTEMEHYSYYKLMPRKKKLQVVYRKTQAHLKSYKLLIKNSQAIQSVSQLMAQLDHMWPMKQLMAQSDHKKSVPVNNPIQVNTRRPKRNTKPPVKLAL